MGCGEYGDGKVYGDVQIFYVRAKLYYSASIMYNRKLNASRLTDWLTESTHDQNRLPLYLTDIHMKFLGNVTTFYKVDIRYNISALRKELTIFAF